MNVEDMKMYWFYQPKEQIEEEIKKGGARILSFKEVGWVDPFLKAPMEKIENLPKPPKKIKNRNQKGKKA